VSSGIAALESLAREPADVLVCDMRMPGMDCWQVLAEAKKLCPQTVRLVRTNPRVESAYRSHHEQDGARSSPS
jgi:CheY-like chemotaxis protein